MNSASGHFSLESQNSKVLFVDDHQLLLDALSVMAKPHYDVRAVDSLTKAEEAFHSFSPDLAIMDVQMPDGSGLELARRILARQPNLKLMFLSMYTDSKFVKEAIDIGAAGYISKKAAGEELLLAIRTVLNGGKYIGVPPNQPVNGAELTERQTEVLRLISQGYSAKEIATELKISVRTAEFHRAAIMDRLKLHSTAMMTRYAIERGIV